MAMKDPMQVAEKWARNLSGSTQAIQDGVAAVTESPTAKAADRADAYMAGVQRSVADGRYQAGLRRVSLDDWKDAMLNKGVQRIAGGATAAVPKMQDFMTQFLPHVAAGQRALANMPRGDLQQNINRMVAMVQHNARFRRRT